jgi:non-homologous end joining protein Ku
MKLALPDHCAYSTLRLPICLEAKIAGRRIAVPEPAQPAASAEVIDLLQALKSSLQPARNAPWRAADSGNAGAAGASTKKAPKVHGRR